MVLSLFIRKDFISHAGKPLDFKIECDNLTDEDIETLAYIASRRILFRDVIGIPRGGLRLAKALEQYKTIGSKIEHPILLVDDVLTTGGSMNLHKINLYPNEVKGLVIFARDENKVPDWVTPIFTMF